MENPKIKTKVVHSQTKTVCTNKYDCYFQTIDMKCNDKTMVCKHRKTDC